MKTEVKRTGSEFVNEIKSEFQCLKLVDVQFKVVNLPPACF